MLYNLQSQISKLGNKNQVKAKWL